MASKFFFNGQLYVSPVTVSAVNDTALQPIRPQIGNTVCLLGLSTGGKPNTKLTFQSPDDAIATLRSGDLLEAVKRAFAPSNQLGGPNQVMAVRVNPAVQSGLTLLDGSSGNAIVLAATDYGQWTNQLKVKVEAGTTAGKKVTVAYGTSTIVGDNLARSPFSIQYAGSGAGTMTVDNTTVALSGNSVVTTIQLSDFPTVQALVDKINSVSGFTATVLGGFGATATLAGLDSVTATDVKTALYTAKADLQAVVDWFNSTAEPYITATRAANAGAPPANLAYTYLTGGTDGSTTNTEWTNAFSTLQTIDAQWIAAISSSSSIHAMADAHVQYMSTVGRKERRSIAGMASGSTDAQAIAEAFTLNSDRTGLVHLGFYDFNAAGVLTLYPPYILAGLIAGAFAGAGPGVALTNKTLAIRGIERNLRNPADTDALILGGVMPIESTPQGFKVTRSISTWLVNDKYNRVELSCGTALDFAVRSVREAVDVLRGERGNPLLLSMAMSIASTILSGCAVQAPVGPGVLVGDADNPPFKNLRANLSGDVLLLTFEASPVIPCNFIGVSVSATPFGATASLAA